MSSEILELFVTFLNFLINIQVSQIMMISENMLLFTLSVI